MSCNPVIIIPEIAQSMLFLADSNGKKIKNVWPFEFDAKAILDDLKGSLMKLMLFRKDGGFSDRVADIVRDFAQPHAVKPDGTKQNNVLPVEFKKSVAECSDAEKRYIYKIAPFDMFGEKICEDKLYFFSYDFLGDIADTAKKLDEYVAFVKDKTGCEKADFVVMGTGGAVLKAYLKDFSVKCDCEKIICVAAALDGSSIVADVYENKIRLDDPVGLLSSLGGKAASVASMAGMVPGEVMNNIISKSLDVIKSEIIDNCTSLWSLIPNSRFENVFESQNIDAVLAEKVKSQYDYSCSFADEIKTLSEKGMKFFFISGCGENLPVLVFSENTDSDGFVDTASSSLGADNENGIGNCAFPEKTWFFKKQRHENMLYNDAVMSLVQKLLADDDVTEYPRLNGSRNVKMLKNELIPKISEVLSDDAHACVAEYERILGAVVVENDAEIKNLETKIKSILASINE